MTTDLTPEQKRADAFRQGWNKADLEGRTGERVIEGLRTADDYEVRANLIPLSFGHYQRETDSTAIYPESGTGSAMALAYVGLGLGEVGELQGKIKKVLRDDGGELTEEKRLAMVGELGDVLWYAARMATELGMDLGDVAKANLSKLHSRLDRGVLTGSGDER